MLTTAELVPIATDPDRTVAGLLALEDDDALEQALADLPAGVAARAVCVAPSLEQKTQILWAMEDRQRREALEFVPPALVAALIQNIEEDNRYLLGDLSIEAFGALLRLCSAERQFYWILTALSFTDARANALPLMLPTHQLVEIFLTRAEWEIHVRGLGDFPIENTRLPSDAFRDPAQSLVDLFGAEGFLRQFPVNDPDLAQAIQLILDFDQDRYVDLIRSGLRSLDYADNHPDEWVELTETPILLDPQGPIDLVDLSSPLPEVAAEMDGAGEGDGAASWMVSATPSLALQPIGSPPLAQMEAALPPAVRQRVADDLQRLYIRQAIAEGGSFLRYDLERVARSVEAYLLLGLEAEAGSGPERHAALVSQRPLHKISHTGARVVERLRQPALRLQHLAAVLAPEQRALVQSLTTPRLTLSPEGQPRLRLMPGAGLPETVDFIQAAAHLRDVQVWAAIARSLGLARTEQALKSKGSYADVLAELALAAILYMRLELGLVEASDAQRFAARYLSPVARELLPEAPERLSAVAAKWASASKLETGDLLPLLERGLAHLQTQLSEAPEAPRQGTR